MSKSVIEVVKGCSADKLAVPVKENFFKAKTIDELILSSIVHEVNHESMMASMLKVLK
ncbi:hypothetical protein LJR153_006204 [Paenibacillus sp. LjRoot153]|uniref:hypothetical protein n=1 Tax=Paenibacillus sp. LjRoot153 TaxID=3342270 RepID=UPI003ECCE912